MAASLRQKRGDGIGKTKRGKGTKWMVVVDGQGVPLGSHLTSASPAEVKLAETTLDAIWFHAAVQAGRRSDRCGSLPTGVTTAIHCASGSSIEASS